MGSSTTIDKERVLDTAWRLVDEHGVASLTIDTVAQAAGISRRAVRSWFKSREGMLEALLMRLGATYDVCVATVAGRSPSVAQTLRAHIALTTSEDEANAWRAKLVALLLHSPDHLTWVRDWYSDRSRELEVAEGAEGARLRLAFFATEGMFLLHYLGLMGISRDNWTRYSAETLDSVESTSA